MGLMDSPSFKPSARSTKLASFASLTKDERERARQGRQTVALGSRSFYRKGDNKRFYEYTRRILRFDDNNEPRVKMAGEWVSVQPVRTVVIANGSRLSYIIFMFKEEANEAQALAQAEALHDRKTAGSRAITGAPARDEDGDWS